ncbi:hypothetical protein [Oscillatoria sp. HE19RPO]|uniref:hypothetical protein n=1 Tax=Oscillatoria sp. HE19RPO TaxID=2954806 RepID=UPI0020C21E84|nr:hypothetical protein [Oscillatoria sp. HE19RPO]
MKKVLAIVGILGILISAVSVIVGVIWTLRIIGDQWGTAMALLGVLFFPATFSLLPWYVGLVLGNWGPLALLWGGVFAMGICQALLET